MGVRIFLDSFQKDLRNSILQKFLHDRIILYLVDLVGSKIRKKHDIVLTFLNLYIYVYFSCLGVCSFVSNKRQNGWTDRTHILWDLVWPQGSFMDDWLDLWKFENSRKKTVRCLFTCLYLYNSCYSYNHIQLILYSWACRLKQNWKVFEEIYYTIFQFSLLLKFLKV